MTDSREQLEADINRFLSNAGTDEMVTSWLDRQAAITRAECDVELRDFIDVKALADNPALPTNDCAAKVMIDCTLPPSVYCEKYNYLEGNPDESECVERMCKHIAIRITSITRADRDEWKAKAEEYRLRVADYECELVRNEGECRRFTIPPKTCVRDGRMCQAVLKEVDGE